MNNLTKKPNKSILRKLPAENYARKNAKFDELNIMATLHPPGKDYSSHTKGEEDKTPYMFSMQSTTSTFFDNDLLAMKLRLAANTQTPSFGDEDLSDDEFPETDEEKVQRVVFERRRKAHYNEYSSVRLARRLIQEDLIKLAELSEEKSSTYTDVSAKESEVESEMQSSEIDSTENDNEADDVARTEVAAKPPIPVAPKPAEIDDMLSPSHPCYGRIVKQQQLREQQQMREKYLQEQANLNQQQEEAQMQQDQR